MPRARQPRTIQVSWDEYFQLITRLAKELYKNSLQYDMVVGIANGGLVPALIISYLLGLPVGYIAARSYRAPKGSLRRSVRDRVVLSRSLCTTAKVGRTILLVDDITDSGTTMERSMAWLRERYPRLRAIVTATIWHKTCSDYEPDFAAQLLKPHHGQWPWIVQPMERQFEEQPFE